MFREMQPHEFDQVFEIMRQAFPESERRPEHAQKALLQKEPYHIYVIEQEKKICGFVALWVFDTFLFLEHLATDASVRNQGLGHAFLEEIQKNTDKRLILEVEPPKTELTRRRVGFYERNGFILNSYEYFQPPLSEDSEAIPLFLMSTKGALNEEEFQTIRKQIYQTVYG